MICRHCRRPIKRVIDPWGGVHGWYHPTIEREVNIAGQDVMIHATTCESGDEAEPLLENIEPRLTPEDMVGPKPVVSFWPLPWFVMVAIVLGIAALGAILVDLRR